MIANFPYDFKTVRIFPDEIFHMISKLSGFFQMTANFSDYIKTVRIFPDDCQKTGPQTPFSYISALFGPFYNLFGPFLTLFNTQTPFLALLGAIC